MTPFERVVCETLVKAGGETDHETLRRHLLAHHYKRAHPAAVACNLTKLAFQDRYVAACWSGETRYLKITPKGREALAKVSGA